MEQSTVVFTDLFWEYFYHVLIFLIFIVTPIIWHIIVFKKSAYYKVTHNGFLATRLDKGKNGEYLCYRHLKHYEKSGGKFLFNIYLPKENGETTEIDVLLISTQGIFVLESKNYSGWIFGDDRSKNWTQSLPQGRGRPSHKEHFLSPIFQNKLHTKALSSVIGDDYTIYSVIVFSERCTLRRVSVSDNRIKVINMSYLNYAIQELSLLTTDYITQSKVDDIYNLLYPYSQVTEEIKAKHIDDIKINHIINQNVDKNEVVEDIIERAITDNQENETAQENSEEVIVDLQLKCPKCGGELVLRTAKKGENAGKQFFGCSNFPKCRYITEKEINQLNAAIDI